MRIQGISISIVTRLWAGQPGFDSWYRQGFFIFTIMSRPCVRTSHPSSNGYQVIFPEE